MIAAESAAPTTGNSLPFLFEDQQDVLSPDFDIVEAIENAVPVEDILAAGEKWRQANPKMLDVLRALQMTGEIFGEETAADWIANSNPRLDGRSPSDVIEQDEEE